MNDPLTLGLSDLDFLLLLAVGTAVVFSVQAHASMRWWRRRWMEERMRRDLVEAVYADLYHRVGGER